MQTVHVHGKKIGPESPAFVVAEIGINHNGDIKTAEKLITEAARSGVDAVKFQTYVTEKRVPKDSPIFGILKQCELTHQHQTDLKALAEASGLIFFSTPFDEESVDFLMSLDVALYKIASFDLVNLALIRKVALTKRPVIASRGMANRAEIDKAVQILQAHSIPFILLHCISAYPMPKEQANLNVIRFLAATYDCPVGYSDHSLGVEVPVYAVAVGAKVIEKHFTLDRAMTGPDHALSADPQQLAQMVSRIRELEAVLGQSDFGVYSAEQPTLVYRRPSN
jgi:sialic acid synthase SpsE